MIDYKPNWLFKFKHINTCFPTLFRKIKVDYSERERLTTYDGDFIDIDWIKNGNDKLVILCHGLEGSSRSKYIQAHAKYFSERNWDVIALNYRGCTVVNLKPYAYHGGMIEDLKLIIEEKGKNYKEIVLGGFSLGGNMVLKYLGTEKLPDNLICGFAVSPPCDFMSSNKKINNPENNIYCKRFLTKLKNKCQRKYESHLEWHDLIDIEKIKKAKNIEEFDEAYTGKFFGFKGAKDYYLKVSSKQNIIDIPVPTYILMPLDDPMMGEGCYPFEESKKNKNITFETPKYGGHVGFSSFDDYPYVLEKSIYNFVKNVKNKGLF